MKRAVSVALALVGCDDVFSIDYVEPPPPQMVCAEGFCIDRTEVTVTAYAEFFADIATSAPALRDECAGYNDFMPARTWPPSPGDERPITNVSWCDAAAYCAWAGKRLCGRRQPNGGPVAPSDNRNLEKDEWTFACTGGDPDRAYAYGPVYQADVCNDSRSSGPLLGVLDNPGCVGGLPGLFNMSGNAWEWEDSCHSAALDSNCYIRGGAFNDGPATTTCMTAVSDPHLRTNKVSATIGFRCCADL